MEKLRICTNRKFQQKGGDYKGSEMEMLEVKTAISERIPLIDLSSRQGQLFNTFVITISIKGVFKAVLLLYFMLGGYRTFKRL